MATFQECFLSLYPSPALLCSFALNFSLLLSSATISMSESPDHLKTLLFLTFMFLDLPPHTHIWIIPFHADLGLLCKTAGCSHLNQTEEPSRRAGTACEQLTWDQHRLRDINAFTVTSKTMVQDNLWSVSLQCHWFCFCLCSYCHPSEISHCEKAQMAHGISSSQGSLAHVSHNFFCLPPLLPVTQLSYCAPKDVMVLKHQEGNNERTNSENILLVTSRMGIAVVLIHDIQN